MEDSAEDRRFRAEARAWLDANAVPRGHPDDDSVQFHDRHVEAAVLFDRCRLWQRRLFDAGWAGITYPRRYGGREATAMQELIFQEEQSAFGVTTGAFAVAHTMVGPAILEFGTGEQRDRFIKPMLRGDEIWCQLFSEPGSGSDLASLRTRAVLDGDEWVVNGQKVWTSNAEASDWGILLARSDPSQPKHRGITYFLLDMATPGVEIRPLKQMTGDEHFSEVFLTDVRIPAPLVLGGPAAVNQGWRAAIHTLSNERAMIGGADSEGDVERLIALARAAGRSRDPSVRRAVAAAYERSRILDFFGRRSRTALAAGRGPGPETSVVKLFFAEHVRAVGELAMSLLGPAGTLDALDTDVPAKAPLAASGPLSTDPGARAYFEHRFLYGPSLRIAGGTNEVQRTIIAERVLGLPAEPRHDRDVPFRQSAGGAP